MTIQGAIAELGEGLKAHLKGVQWTRQHPRYLGILLLPALMGILVVAGILVAAIKNGDSILLAMAPLLDQLAAKIVLPGEAGPWLVFGLVMVAVTVVAVGVGLLITFGLGSPIHDWVSSSVEHSILGDRVPPGISWLRSLTLVATECAKLFLVWGIILALAMLPVLKLAAIPAFAVLLAWEFADYTLARRGMSLKERVRWVGRNVWRLLGFGLGLSLPVVQLILIPIGVISGTLLAVESLESEAPSRIRDNRLSQNSRPES